MVFRLNMSTTANGGYFLSKLLTEREEASLYLFRNERYNEWNYRCNKCGVRLKVLTNLDKHWRRHHPEWIGFSKAGGNAHKPQGSLRESDGFL